jgi:GMP synthase (glutamine-hydrolysing)
MTLGSLARRPTVLIVLHQEHSTPGRVGVALKAMQVRLDIRRPSCGDPLPDTLADHDGVVVFGGPMGANDTFDWVRREIKWLETPLAEDKPLLALCLGAQMLARALGARVFSYEDKRSEDRLLFNRTHARWRSAVSGPVSARGLSMAF